MKNFTSSIKKVFALLMLLSLSMVSHAQETGVYKIKTNLTSADNLIISFAATNGNISVAVNDGDFVPYEVSTDINKKTPLMFTPGIDNPEFTMKGDLTAFDAPNEKIYDFQVSGNNSLVLLNLAQNKLTSVSLADGENIRYCYLLDNAIETIDFGKAVNIEELNVNYNMLTDIDISAQKNLKAFSCDHNAIGSLDVSSNLMLESLYCKKNKLQTLNISSLSLLRELSCESNQIETLDVTNNPALEILYCKDNKLNELNVTSCAALVELNCSENEIEALDLSSCANLIKLYCFTNKLSELNLSNSASIEVISCGDNALTSLDLAGLSSLQSLSVSYNSISELNLTGCSFLMAVGADHNKLTRLDLTDCAFLFMADVSFNEITNEGSALMASTIAERTEDEFGIIIFTNSQDYPDDVEHNQCSVQTMEAFNNKYWILTDGEEEFIPTSINSVKVDADNISAVYDTNGIKKSKVGKGLNIVVLKNGKTIKVCK